MELPKHIVESGLYSRLKEDEELLYGLTSMRSVAISLAETTYRTVPDFTNHTVRHMDALWWVADRVLTQDEIAQLTPAEAFLLSSGFYLHDIGMAYAATEAGVARIKDSNEYRGFIAALPENKRLDPKMEARAIAVAVRHLHADAAKELATHEVPGSEGRYLFEAKSFRAAWGPTCGEVASSHHWSISELDARFGPQGETPLPGNRRGDLLYVAACLRLIDYAHINRDRASSLDRAFRFPLSDESLVHWLAQENVDGPERDSDELVYHAAQPIADVDAWWLYYEMLNGLDGEIRGVKRLLNQRKEGHKRISLSGVRGAASPEQAVPFIQTSGFLPIEINLRTGSIDRLVELLAGETLYGPNPMAAVRELIQNARDAVMLKAEIATDEADKATLSLPIRISLNTKVKPPTLDVLDHGVGMTKTVMTDFLISIASDYWTSQFAIDFPTAAEMGFKSAGKFGIGFLSVFMLGAEVTVESNRAGGERYRLSLRGVGRRGELRQLSPPPGSGTVVRVKLKASTLEGITPLDELVKTYAPTLPHALQVEVDGTRTDLPAGWLKNLEADAFKEWVLRATETIRRRDPSRSTDDDWAWYRYVHYGYRDLDASVDMKRGTPWPHKIPEYARENDRLIASFEGVSLLCLRGLAVQPVWTPGFVGVIDLDSAAPDVSRSRAVNADLTEVLEDARNSVTPQIVKNLNALSEASFLIQKTPFIAACVSFYGRQVILKSDVPWISHLKMPGNVELINSQTLITSLASSNLVFVAFNTGPWTAMKRWVDAERPAATEIGVLVDGEGQQTPGYITADEKKVGSLDNLWPECVDGPLFGTLIGIIAEAWQMSPEELLKQEGWTHSGSAIYGRFRRP